MKKILMMGIAAIAAMAMTDARALSLTDAGAKVPEAAEKPATMAEVMNQLSEADQLKFLATVNEAIAKMPISEDEKVARYVEANTAAVKAAANRTAMLAEIFATASPAALAVINEKFAPAIFDPSKQLSAEEKKTAAEAIMKVIESRTAESEVKDAEKRNAAAVLMFTRADAGLKDALLANEANGEQMSKWIDASVKGGSYKWLVGSGEAVNKAVASVMQTAPDALSGMVLADMAAVGTDAPFSDAVMDANQYALPPPMNDYGLNRIPRTLNKENKWYNGAQRGDKTSEDDRREPSPYFGQGTR